MRKCPFGLVGPWVGLCIIVLLGGMEIQAQVKSNCTLRGRDTVTSTGVTIRQCLDLSALDAKTVVIPANVTQIDSTGFSLCESAETEGGLADIVYIMDQSGSMKLQHIWINPDGTDTVMLHGKGGCTGLTNADYTNYGTVTVLRGTGTAQVPRINPSKKPTGCVDFSGDPFEQRAIAFKEAIDFQAARAPNSTAGFMGFAQGVRSPTRPVRLNTPGNIASVKDRINVEHANYTNYKAPLDSAKKWLLNPAITPNPAKAIIFLSDGRPTYPDNPDSYQEVLSATYPLTPGVMPPVYGIYLGRPNVDTLRLYQMSIATGGQFFLIPPDRPDSLKAVVARIQTMILRQYQPNSTEITNQNNSQTASAGSTMFTRQQDGSWLINFNRPVALQSQASNKIALSTTFRELVSDTLRPKNINFSLNTTGPDESTNRNLPGTQFSVKCVELPPEINVVRVAYIKDTDADGAGDKVFFVFTRPLTALPAAIDTIYWNKVAPGFNNKVAPKLSFLPGSNNTVVIADLTASPFPKGLTSIPAGEKPIGVLPQGGVLLGQRPAINDSIGPILDSGLAKPFDNSKVTGGGALNLDTLVIYVSEEMRTNTTWDNMLLWGKPVNGQCNDFANAKPVVPARQPIQNPDQKSFIILVANGQGGPTPVVGDCIYLNVDGTQTDLVRNVPATYGIQLRGRRPPREIELFRGFPPVVGFDDASKPGFLLVTNDPRKGDNLDYSKPNDQGIYQVYWVPPVGYVNGQPFHPMIPANPAVLPVGQDATTAGVLPRNISTIQVVSTGKYIAQVSIFDNHGQFMKSFIQAFGYQGELNNGARVATKGLVSYLVWDLKDSKNRKAGQGVYIWKVIFRFENGKQEIQYTRTGLMRNLDPVLPTP